MNVADSMTVYDANIRLSFRWMDRRYSWVYWKRGVHITDMMLMHSDRDSV